MEIACNFNNNAISPVTARSQDLDEEVKFLLENGIQYIYNRHHIKTGQYLRVEDLKFPLTYGKCVYLIAAGTSIAYVIPYYVLMGYSWFKNALNETQFKSVLIHTHRDNIILRVEPPHPDRMSYLSSRLLRGSQDSYIIDYQKESIKEHFEYFCIDVQL